MFTFLIEYWKENFIEIVKIKRTIRFYIFFHRAKTPATIKKIVII
jgi:hypothetical protein